MASSTREHRSGRSRRRVSTFGGQTTQPSATWAEEQALRRQASARIKGGVVVLMAVLALAIIVLARLAVG
jgi:hypothetical protein